MLLDVSVFAGEPFPILHARLLDRLLRRSITHRRGAHPKRWPSECLAVWQFWAHIKSRLDRKFKFITTNWKLKIKRKNKSFWANLSNFENLENLENHPSLCYSFVPLWPIKRAKVQVRKPRSASNRKKNEKLFLIVCICLRVRKRPQQTLNAAAIIQQPIIPINLNSKLMFIDRSFQPSERLPAEERRFLLSSIRRSKSSFLVKTITIHRY